MDYALPPITSSEVGTASNVGSVLARKLNENNGAKTQSQPRALSPAPVQADGEDAAEALAEWNTPQQRAAVSVREDEVVTTLADLARSRKSKEQVRVAPPLRTAPVDEDTGWSVSEVLNKNPAPQKQGATLAGAALSKMFGTGKK